MRDEVGALERQAESYAARKGLLAQLDDVRRHLASVEERMARLPDASQLEAARERVSDLRASLTAISMDGESMRTAWVRDAQDAKTKRQGLLDQYQELKDQRQRIVTAGRRRATAPPAPGHSAPNTRRCWSCSIARSRRWSPTATSTSSGSNSSSSSRASSTSSTGAASGVEHELSEATSQLGRLQAQAQEAGALREEQARLQLRVHELEAALARVLGSYDQARHEALVAQVPALEPLALQAERLRVVAERREAIAAELAAACAEREAAGGRAAELSALVSGLGYTEAAYRAAREDEAAAERTRRDTELALVRARGESAGAAEAVEAAVRRLAERAEREREAIAAGAELALHQELDRALTDLRTELNATLRPDLSELASGFLRDLTNGRYTDLELDEDYCATLLDDGDPKAVISGGEEDVSNLALRLAISQMIAERAGQPLSLLVLDEIFGSLDEDRRAAVVDLLRSLADRFPQVILITHIDSVREGFDRVIRVGFDAARGVAIVRDEPVGGHEVAA